METAGLHARQIQAFAGHASIVTTLDRYGHIFPGAETALAENLEAMIAKASGTAEVIPFPLPAE